MADAQRIVVLGFETREGAQQALDAALRLQKEGKLLVRDAVFVHKDADGKRAHVQETVDQSTGSAALGGAFWGLLFGVILLVPIAGMAIGAGTAALVAKLTDTGIDDKFVKHLRDSIQPGWTYLALMVSHADREAVLADLRRLRGIAELVDSSMPEEAVRQVRDALADTTPAKA